MASTVASTVLREVNTVVSTVASTVLRQVNTVVGTVASTVLRQVNTQYSTNIISVLTTYNIIIKLAGAIVSTGLSLHVAETRWTVSVLWVSTGLVLVYYYT